jgi:hypothetical protein
MNYTFPKIFLISPDPTKIHGLELAGDFTILAGKSSSYLRAAKKRGINIEFLKLPKIKTTAGLLQDASVQKKLKPGSKLLIFKNLPKIEKIALKNKWQILLPKPHFVNLLEDKINFLEFAKKNELPILPTQVKKMMKIEFIKPIVIQLRRGHAGETTFFIKTKKELTSLKKTLGEWVVKITPLKKLPTFSLDLCVTSQKIFSTQPFYQITGDPRLNPLPGGTGGIDFDLAQKILSAKIQQKIFALVKKIGDALCKIGYRGIAGIDFLVDISQNKIFLLECNPRLLSNLGFITQKQTEICEIPLLTLHLLEFLGKNIPVVPAISQLKSGRFELKHKLPNHRIL